MRIKHVPGYRGLWAVSGTKKPLADGNDDIGKEEKEGEARGRGRGRRKSRRKARRGSAQVLYWVRFCWLVISSGVSRSDVARPATRYGRKRKAGQYPRRLWLLGC